MSRKIYSIDRSDMLYLERVWDFAQYHDLNMYKTRITRYQISWVIEIPPGKLETRYLLEFAQHSTNLMGHLYY